MLTQGVTAVVASSLVGLVGAMVGHSLQLPHLPPVIFAGSFVGMTGLQIAPFYTVSLAGAMAGFIYNSSLYIFAGFGGRLGTIAFVSTISIIFALSLLKKILSTLK